MKGTLLDIGPEELTIQTIRRGKWEIPKKDIRYIQPQKNKATKGIFGSLLAIIGITAFAIGSLYFLIFIFSAGATGGSQMLAGFIIGGLASIISMFLFFSATTISEPFSDKWEITEKSQIEYKPMETAPDSKP